MNNELNGLLRLLGVDGVDDRNAWRCMSMVLNHGCVPSRQGLPSWGFKLLILDRRGRPEWFARCSWSSRSEMLRETELLDALTLDPFAHEHVPEHRTGYTERIFVQLNRHLGARAYSAQLPRINVARWASDVGGIIDVAEALMERATALVPALRAHASAADRKSSVGADLARIAHAGVSSRAIESLALSLKPIGELPFVLQHGDLWPSNVIRSADRWWVIDYSECGFVWVPLYDVFHLLHNGPPSATQLWYAQAWGKLPDAWSRARWALVRRCAERHGLSARDVGTCLVHYLVHLAAYRLRPGVPLMWSTALLATIEQVGSFLADGGTTATLIPWKEPGAQAS